MKCKRTMYTQRQGQITVIHGANHGWMLRSTRAAVRMVGNDGENSFDVQANSLRQCRVMAKQQGIKFPRKAR